MKFYGQAEKTANKILDAFKTGDIPAAMASVFIHRKDDAPCRKWSWSNQLMAALFGGGDARGYRQWQAVGRQVKKGQKAIAILVPLIRKVEDKKTGKEKTCLYGFKNAPVFGVHQTEGEPLQIDQEAAAFITSLPLIEVAGEWGINVDSYTGNAGSPCGYYAPNSQAIALGVENLSTWAHELIHAADDRNVGGLKNGQDWAQEVVAELGGAIMLEILGYEKDSDRGGCWQYVDHYAEQANLTPLVACEKLLKRACEAVALILEEAVKLELVAA